MVIAEDIQDVTVNLTKMLSGTRVVIAEDTQDVTVGTSLLDKH